MESTSIRACSEPMTVPRLPIKVVVAKIGLDGHDRGIKVIARSLRDEGMEVVYLGMRLTGEQVAAAAAEEDADVVGISLLSGAHLRLIPKLVDALKAQDLHGRVLLVAGGTIPDKDVEPLRQMGVDGVFPVGTPMSTIADFIKQGVRRD